MLFNSYVFILLFLPITVIGFYTLSSRFNGGYGKVWLFGASLFFYGHWFPPYLLLILTSICANYFLSEKLMDKDIGKRKILFLFGLFLNLGSLAYFKYFNFFIDNVTWIFNLNMSIAKIALPLGISFFTLQQVAFLVDSYQGLGKKKSFIDYALFVSFFPQLIAGPIVHYQSLIPQFFKEENKKFKLENFNLGIYIFILGLSKKVLLADTFSAWSKIGFNYEEPLHFFFAWGTSLSYTFQLYFDFSGYSDMAIGLGLLFNINIPKNFNSPFKARNIVEFWNRWHITLTQFITAYIYTPLFRAMPKLSFNFSMLSMLVTMTIAGLWHGAAWTFILYGVLHGLAIIVNHTMKKYKIKLPKILACFLCFNFINISFTIFRAESFNQALNIFKGMFAGTYIKVPKGVLPKSTVLENGMTLGQHMNNDENLNLLFIILGFFIVYKLKNTMELKESFEPTRLKGIVAGALFVICLFGLNRVSEFIYFNF